MSKEDRSKILNIGIAFLAIIGAVWIFRGLSYEELIHNGDGYPESTLQYKVSSWWGLSSKTYNVRPVKREGFTYYEYFHHKSKKWVALPEL